MRNLTKNWQTTLAGCVCLALAGYMAWLDPSIIEALTDGDAAHGGPFAAIVAAGIGLLRAGDAN